MSTKDASEHLGVTLRTLYRFIDEGDLPGTGFGYLPIHRAAGGGWSVGPPCTPR